MIFFLRFQFPSNGKVETKKPFRGKCIETKKVSIPFKRESGAKVVEYLKENEIDWKVSIPFKRESVAKAQ